MYYTFFNVIFPFLASFSFPYSSSVFLLAPATNAKVAKAEISFLA